MPCFLSRFFLLEKEDVTAVLDPVLERMPPLDIDSAKMLRREEEETSESSSEEESESEEVSEDDGVADLLGILDNRRISFEDGRVEPVERSGDNEERSAELANMTREAEAEPSSEVKPQSAERSTYELQAYANHGVSVVLVCKAGKEEGETFVRAEVRNENDQNVDYLELQMIVPKYMQMQQKALSSEVVPAHNEGVCTQLFRLRNNSDGEKETVVRLRIMFQLGQEEVNEMVQVSGFDDEAWYCLFTVTLCGDYLARCVYSQTEYTLFRPSHSSSFHPSLELSWISFPSLHRQPFSFCPLSSE